MGCRSSKDERAADPAAITMDAELKAAVSKRREQGNNKHAVQDLDDDFAERGCCADFF